MANYRTARQWASIIERYESSGLTQVAFCRRHHLALSTLAYQLRRYRAGRDTTGESSSQPQLVELTLATGQEPFIPGSASPGVRIELCAPQSVPVSIHCQSGQVGEILAQIPNLLPSDS